MTNEAITEMIIGHDKTIDRLATITEQSIKNVESLTKKLDDVIAVITRQNILAEQVTYLETNCRESFDRHNNRLSTVEDTQNNGGCSIAKNLRASKDLFAEKIKVSNHRLDIVEKDLKALREADLDNRLMAIEDRNKKVLQALLGAALTIIVGFIVTNISIIEHKTTSIEKGK